MVAKVVARLFLIKGWVPKNGRFDTTNNQFEVHKIYITRNNKPRKMHIMHSNTLILISLTKIGENYHLYFRK